MKANPNAWCLATVIALRARWHTSFSADDELELGQARLGDHDEYGLTMREYRTAKKNLEKWGFATFEGTKKGTLAKLTDARLFRSVPATGDNQGDQQAAIRRPTGGNQATTNKEREKEIRREGEPKAPPPGMTRRSQPITFVPVKLGLFPREYEKLLRDAETEIARIENARDSWTYELTPEAKDLVDMLKREGHESRAAEVLKRSDCQKRVAMTPEAVNLLRSWKERRVEIRAAMNGVVAAEASR